MKVIVGLGNPGKAYEDTRHNVGWWVIDHLAGVWRFDGWRKDQNALVERRTGWRAAHPAGEAADLHEPERRRS